MQERVENSLCLTLITKYQRKKVISLSITFTALSRTSEFLETAKSSSACEERSCWGLTAVCKCDLRGFFGNSLQMPNLQHILHLYVETGDGTVEYKALQHGVHGFHSLQGGQKSIELFLWPSSPPGAGSEPLGSSGVALGLKSCCVQTSCSTRSGRGRGEAGKANLGPGPALVSGCVSTGKQGSSSAGLGVLVPHPAHTLA